VKSRVLIVESHPLLRRRLCNLIGAVSDFDVIGDCPDGRQALRLATAQAPDLVVLDLFMAGLNGIEAAAQIKQSLPQVRVAVLTSDKTPEYVQAALRAGVDGYVLKDASFGELVTALRSILAGKKFFSPSLPSPPIVPDAACAEARPVQWDELSERERSIGTLIAQGHTNRAAAEILDISPKTVEKHRASLMRKLGLHNAAELKQFARRHGVVPEPERSSSQLSLEFARPRPDAPSGQAPPPGP